MHVGLRLNGFADRVKYCYSAVKGPAMRTDIDTSHYKMKGIAQQVMQ